jgi:flagellar biosynthetic protein FliO
VKAFLTVMCCFIFAGFLFASTSSKPESAAPAPATVQEPSAADSTPAPASEAPMEEYRFPILRTLGGLGLVLTLIVAGFFAARKFAPQYFTKRQTEKNLQVIETLPMGDKRSISIIQVANNRFLVGNTSHQINLLTALPEQFSIVSETESPLVEAKKEVRKESKAHFKNIFEIEKSRPSPQAGHPLPDDLRTKMRQLREALERG